MTKPDNALPAPIALTFEQASQVTGGALVASLIKYAGPLPPALLSAALQVNVLPAVQAGALLPAV